MVRFVRLWFGILVRLFHRRQSLLIENLALRQQLVMLKRRHPRPSLGLLDKLLRTGLALLGSSCCTESIIVFTPIPPEPPRFGPRLKLWRTTPKEIVPPKGFTRSPSEQLRNKIYLDARKKTGSRPVGRVGAVKRLSKNLSGCDATSYLRFSLVRNEEAEGSNPFSSTRF